MSGRTRLFSYSNDPQSAPGDLVGTIPAEIRTDKDLVRALAKELRFPDYFGENWNAVYDCLCDFHWTSAFRIVLIHRNLPDIGKEALKLYLDTLADAVRDWKPGEAHELVVVFPKTVEREVEEILSGR